MKDKTLHVAAFVQRCCYDLVQVKWKITHTHTILKLGLLLFQQISNSDFIVTHVVI